MHDCRWTVLTGVKWSKASSKFMSFLYILTACISFWIVFKSIFKNKKCLFSSSKRYKDDGLGPPSHIQTIQVWMIFFSSVGWIIIKMRTYERWSVYNICFKIMNKTSLPFSQGACHPCNANSHQCSFCSHGAGVNKVFFSWTSNITLTISKMNYVCSKYFSFEYIPFNWGK